MRESEREVCSVANIILHFSISVFQMLSLANNPFSWSQAGNISGVVGSLSISKENGLVIPIENLAEEIEVRAIRHVFMTESMNTLFGMYNIYFIVYIMEIMDQ